MTTISKFEKSTGIKFNKAMTGKMEGITCLSTSNLCNPYCAARKDRKDMICSRCYADATCKNYKGLRENMARNTEILTSTLFEVEDFPIINALIFRLEAFGDLINCTQAQNYIRLAKRNPGVHFALWCASSAPHFSTRAVMHPVGRLSTRRSRSTIKRPSQRRISRSIADPAIAWLASAAITRTLKQISANN